MLEESDVFIALPGGIGTLDEVFTVAAAATIGYHSKRVILYNLKDFWHPLIALLDSLQAQGLMRRPWQSYIAVASTLEELSGIISS